MSSKLTLIINATGDIAPLCRLLASVERQTVKGVDAVAVTDNADRLAAAVQKYELHICESKSGFENGFNDEIKKLDSEFFMICACDQLFAVDFYENILPYLDTDDGILMNIAKKRANGRFGRVYCKDSISVSQALKVRPCVNCCVFKTDIVKKHGLSLRSLSLAHQLEFLREYFALCEKTEYIPQTRVYIDNIAKSAKPSVIAAFSQKGHTGTVLHESLLDMAYPALATDAYRKLCRAKRFFVRGVKHVLKR